MNRNTNQFGKCDYVRFSHVFRNTYLTCLTFNYVEFSVFRNDKYATT